VDQLGLVGAELGGLGLQADEVGVLTGHDVGIGLPPAALLGLAGQLEQRLALGTWTAADTETAAAQLAALARPAPGT